MKFLWLVHKFEIFILLLLFFLIFSFTSLEHTGGKGRATLDLSTQSLTPKMCAVLGKVLATDRNFTEIKFADCMLSEDGEVVFILLWGGLLCVYAYLSVLYCLYCFVERSCSHNDHTL